MFIEKPKRRNRGGRQEQGDPPQQPMPREPQPSHSRGEPSRERRPEPPEHHPRRGNEGTSQFSETGRGSGKNHPRPGGPSAEPMPKDPGHSGHFTPPLQQTPRFQGPSPPQVFQRAPQPGEQQSFWGPRPGQAPFRGPLPRPPFSSTSQKPSIIQQGAQLGTPMTRPHEPQQPAVRAWGAKSTSSDVPPQHPEPGAAGLKPQQTAKKAKGPKNKRGDSQQLGARDDPQPGVSHEPGSVPTEGQVQDSRSGNVWHKTSQEPGSSKKPVDSKKKQGIGDKPVHESLNKALVLGKISIVPNYFSSFLYC